MRAIVFLFLFLSNLFLGCVQQTPNAPSPATPTPTSTPFLLPVMSENAGEEVENLEKEFQELEELLKELENLEASFEV